MLFLIVPRTYLGYRSVSASRPYNQASHITKLRVFATYLSISSPHSHFTTNMSYNAIEARIKDVIEAYYTSENPNRSAIARQFDVSPKRLKSRLKDYLSKITIRGLYNRRLTDN